MEKSNNYTRIPEVSVDGMFYERWSPRAFRSDPIPAEHILSLFEAAKWAPSCYNEQPWFFIYAKNSGDRERFLSALVEKNREWAAQAPLLIFLVAHKRFIQTGNDNRHAAFDCGAAWMSLALQARKLGLYAHAMAGFDHGKACSVLNIPDDTYEVMVAIAVGYRGEVKQLSPDFQAMEIPNTRKALSEIYKEKTF